MNVNEYLKATKRVFSLGEDFSYLEPRLPVVCKDGFTLSIQASKYSYSSPKSDNAEVYTHVEVGYFEENEEDIIKYLGRVSNSECIVSNAPVVAVQKLLDSHGGIDENLLGKRDLVDKLIK